MSDHIGFIYPGEMGAALASLVRKNGYQPLWPSEGRSTMTRSRAQAAGIKDVGTLSTLCRECPVIISICPSLAALQIAQQVAATGYSGLLVDANAISPGHAQEIHQLIRGNGGRFVDGAISGPPPGRIPSQTEFLLAGEDAEEVARYFSGELLKIKFLGPEIGKASALKICQSALQKGELALVLATLATAEKLGVREELEQLLSARAITARFIQDMDENIRRSAKGWRFAAEMTEVAQTFADAGLPDGFHLAASEVFGCLPKPTDGSAISTQAALLETILNGKF